MDGGRKPPNANATHHSVGFPAKNHATRLFVIYEYHTMEKVPIHTSIFKPKDRITSEYPDLEAEAAKSEGST